MDFENRVFTRDNADCGLLSPSDFAPSSLIQFDCGVDEGETNESSTKMKESEMNNFNRKVASLDPKAQALIGKFLMGVTEM